MKFTSQEIDNLQKVTHLLDNGWEVIFNPPEEEKYFLKNTPKGVCVFGVFGNLNLKDAVMVQGCIERIKP